MCRDACWLRLFGGALVRREEAAQHFRLHHYTRVKH
eukprot:SAG31_NODE_47212_length_251_cov_0.684211_1_plen_35_part_01